MRRGKAIHVWAAGNSAEAEIAVSAAWPIIFPDLAGYSIAVAALGADGTIGRQTNHCGAARDHCLTAPGGVAVGDSATTVFALAGGGYRYGYGTSYAAPFVSGVLALMRQAYGDQLTLPEYTARLFGTANKSGVYADASIYGQGLVDVEAALAPYGDTHIPLPAGGVAGPSETQITDGDLPEEMLERLRREKIIVLDALDTPFETNLLPPKITPHSRPRDAPVSQWVRPDASGASSHPLVASFSQRRISSAARRVGAWDIAPLQVQSTRQPRATDPIAEPTAGLGVMARRALAHSSGYLQWGVLAEQNSLMATTGAGGLRFGPAYSGLFSLHRQLPFGRHALHLEAHLSLSQLEGAQDSLLAGSSRAVASSLGLAWHYQRMRVSLRQPTYFETGALKLALPHRRMAGGGVLFRDQRFSLQAPQRPFELAFFRHAPSHDFAIKLEKQAGLARQINLGWVKRF